MTHHNLDIVLTLEGPVLSGSTAPGDIGVDLPMARDHQGRIILSGSLVKGRLLQSWEELNSAMTAETGHPFVPNISELLGQRAPTAEDVETSVSPSRGRLGFTDFVCQSVEKEGYRHRVQMDNRRGTSAQGALLVCESAFASGDTVQFTGTVDF